MNEKQDEKGYWREGDRRIKSRKPNKNIATLVPPPPGHEEVVPSRRGGGGGTRLPGVISALHQI